MIHICFGLYDKSGRYSKFTGTTMLSIFENTNSEVTVHIIHDDTLTPDNRDKFISLVEQYKQRVEFYNVDELCSDKISEMVNLIPLAKTSRLSVAALYRLLIPQILSPDIEKTIYLDSDIIVNMNINELWQIDIGNKPLGVIPEIFNKADVHEFYGLCRDNFVKTENYFNSGVLLINIKSFLAEKETILNGFKFLSKNPQYSIYLDQDLLNYCLSEKVVHLPLKFNRFVTWARKLKDTTIDNKIYHYVVRSFELDMKDPFNRLWMEYFMKTPWFDKDSIGRLYEVFEENYRNIYYGAKSSMINVSTIMSGKTRAFYLTMENLDELKKIFSIRDDEEIILADSDEDAIADLVMSMWKAQGQKVFFLFVPDFPTLSEALKKLDFVPNRDFLNGLDFLPAEQALLFNSHSLIQAM